MRKKSKAQNRKLSSPINALIYGTYNVKLETYLDLQLSLKDKLSLKRIKKLINKA